MVSDSGRLYVAWPVEGFGTPVICTASLTERAEPYLLTLELRRGKIAQLRDQISAWEIAGMTVPADFMSHFDEAHGLFRQATALQDQPAEAGALASEALQRAFEASDLAVRAYAAQRMAARRSDRRSRRRRWVAAWGGSLSPRDSISCSTTRFRRRPSPWNGDTSSRLPASATGTSPTSRSNGAWRTGCWSAGARS